MSPVGRRPDKIVKYHTHAYLEWIMNLRLTDSSNLIQLFYQNTSTEISHSLLDKLNNK